jgi:hypothetical protein
MHETSEGQVVLAELLLTPHRLVGTLGNGFLFDVVLLGLLLGAQLENQSVQGRAAVEQMPLLELVRLFF